MLVGYSVRPPALASHREMAVSAQDRPNPDPTGRESEQFDLLVETSERNLFHSPIEDPARPPPPFRARRTTPCSSSSGSGSRLPRRSSSAEMPRASSSPR